MRRFTMVLKETELDELAQWAYEELREPHDQLRYILLQALAKRRVLGESTQQISRTEPKEVSAS
jgi:hypothetical protein